MKINLQKQTKFYLILIITIYVSAFLSFWFYHFKADLLGFFRLGWRQPLYNNFFDDQGFKPQSRWGYDGQFYLSMAYDPFFSQKLYRLLDNRGQRLSRIFWPFLANLASFGQKKIIPATMILLNFLFFFFSVFLVAKIIQKARAPAFLLLIYAFLPCFVFGLFWLTPDAIAASLMVIAFYFFYENKNWPAALFMILAVLTKESSLLLPAGGVIFYLFKKDFKKAIFFAGPILAYFIWVAFIFYKFGAWPFFKGTLTLSWPFWEISRKILGLFPMKSISFPAITKIILPLSFLLAALCSFKAIYQKPSLVAVTYFLCGFLVITATQPVWENFLGYGRILSLVGLWAFFYFLETKKKYHLIGPAIFSLASFFVLIYLAFFPTTSFLFLNP